MKPRQSLNAAALVALLASSTAWGEPDGGFPPSASVRAARLALPDGGLIDVEDGFYLSPSQGVALAKELAYLRGEKEALEASAATSMPTQYVVTVVALGVVVGAACGFAASRVASH